MNRLILSEYNGMQISFTGDGWFNATDVATRFGKNTYEWLRLPATVDYLHALNRKYGKIPYLKSKRGHQGGTWLHPKLAVRFAQWLDVDFAVWCDMQIDAIIRGTRPEFDQARIRHEAASSYKVMQQILQFSRLDEGKPTAPHHYSNESRLINSLVAGQYASLHRDILTMAELELIAKLEERNSVFLAKGLPYAERKKRLSQYANQIKAQQQSLLAAK